MYLLKIVEISHRVLCIQDNTNGQSSQINCLTNNPSRTYNNMHALEAGYSCVQCRQARTPRVSSERKNVIHKKRFPC